jgi:hypothetical protein
LRVGNHIKALALERDDIVGAYFDAQYIRGPRPFANECRDRADFRAKIQKRLARLNGCKE